VPLPWDFDAALRELQELIGVGPAGPIAGLGGLELDGEGRPTGSARVMRLFGQVMLYAYASGIHYANATDDQVNRFIAWQDWYRSVTEWTSQAVVDNTQLLRKLMTNLRRPDGGTDIYVGHDGNLDGLAAVLDLVWEAPPYMGGMLNPTPPGSGIWFEYDHDAGSLTASYLYWAFNRSAGSEFGLKASEIRAWGSFESFRSEAMARLATFAGALECFQKTGASEELGALAEEPGGFAA